MTYLEGFVIPVPTAKRDDFVVHARLIDPLFIEHGASRVVECWEADLKEGRVTDFYRAVERRPDEAVAFSWVEWPDRAARQAGMARIDAQMKEDPRWDQDRNPMPFDGARMIFGSFEVVVEHGAPCPDSYVQGFVVPVPADRKQDYFRMAEQTWPAFEEYGAARQVEAWGDEVPHGKRTDFHRAVKAEPGENLVFSFLEWPSREICDAAAEKMQNDARMAPPQGMTLPFDGKRMIWGGFRAVYEVGE